MTCCFLFLFSWASLPFGEHRLDSRSMTVSGQVEFVVARFAFLPVQGVRQTCHEKLDDEVALELRRLTPMCSKKLLVGAAVMFKGQILTAIASWWILLLSSACLAFTSKVAVPLLTKCKQYTIRAHVFLMRTVSQRLLFR